MSSLLFADDFVGIAETRSALQSLIDIVHNYSQYWWSETKLNKCVVIIFQKQEKGPGKWVWGEESLSILTSYCYLGVKFSVWVMG